MSFDIRGKDYILLAFERLGDDWGNAKIAELIAPQDELKKVVKKKEGNALPQLQRMGISRRQQINDVARDISGQEHGDVFWEPVVIKTKKEHRAESGKIAVDQFNVLFARRGRKADPASKGKTVKIVVPPKAKEDKPKDSGKEEKPKKYQRSNALNGPFAADPLFAADGKPMDSRGPIPYENAGLPMHIGADRPIGFKPPPPPKEPELVGKIDPLFGAAPKNVLGDLDALFGPEFNPGKIEGIVEVPEDHGHGHGHRRTDSRHEPRPRSSRRHSGIPEERRYPSNNRYSDVYSSSRSSWASDDSAIMGEWSDLSSRTSEESYYSSPRSQHKKTYRTITPGRKYYYRDSRLQPGDRLVVESTRKPRLLEDRRDSIGLEEPLQRRSSTSRPTVHQSYRPQSRQQDIPPEVPYVQTYSRERDRSRERRADDYIREKEWESANQRPSSNRRYSFDPRANRQSGYF